MSSSSRITDDEMRYFQFKARQQFLVKKEDHEWNEFCKRNKCTCCSCLPPNTPIMQKDAAIQATEKSTVKFNQNTSAKRVLDKPLSKSVNDIKTELEKLKLVVADIKFNHTKDGKEFSENIAASNIPLRNESALNLLSEQRQNLIRASLLNSLQRLHSSSTQKITKPPVSIPSHRNKGFFLPSNLERQRLIARNAYLSSLINKPKVIGKTHVMPLDNRRKKLTGNNKKQSSNIPSKTRKSKNAPTVKLKEEKTLIESEASEEAVKDENIENVVDAIVDDLLREEIIDLNRIRYMKLEKQSPNQMKAKGAVSTKLAGSAKKDIHFSQPSPEIRAKIKQIPFFDLIQRKSGNSSFLENSSQSHPVDFDEQSKTVNCPTAVSFENTCDKHVSFQTPPTSDKAAQVDINTIRTSKPFRTIHTDPKLAKRVTRQRKLYFQYLERVSRSRTHNFDPIAVSKMVAESLLNDCISDVCEELDDVPTSLIGDLYKQEFTSTL